MGERTIMKIGAIKKKKEPNGFERNKNNWAVLATVIGMFAFAITWIILTAK